MVSELAFLAQKWSEVAAQKSQKIQKSPEIQKSPIIQNSPTIQKSAINQR